MSDNYVWLVKYRDGSEIGQIDNNGEDTGSWRKVDVRNVAKIVIVPKVPDLPIHGIAVPPEATAFLTFRRTQELVPATGEQITHPALVVAGWEKDGAESYLYVDIYGNAIMTNDRDRLPE